MRHYITVSLWMRKKDPHVYPAGDALFSWAPSGALTPKQQQGDGAAAAAAGDHAVVLLMPDSRLNYTVGSEHVLNPG